MGAILDIPPELLDVPLRLINKKSLKNLRLVNRAFNDVASPYLYETVRFDLVEILPLNSLIQIARHEKLRRCVKRLVLQRRYGLRDFPFDEHQYYIEQPNRGPTEEKLCSDTREWERRYYNLSWSERLCLAEVYEVDRKNLEKEARQISRSLQFRSLGYKGCAERVRGSEDQKVPMTLHDSLLESFDEAICAFSNLKEFSHEPAYKHNLWWSLQWREFGFDREYLNGYTNSEEDEDVENLQISIVLRALGRANYFTRNLQSLRFDIEGPAFWTAERLKWLWHGHEHLTLKHRYHLNRRDNMKPLRQDDLTGQEIYLYHEQLLIMKHAFTYLHHLDISIDLRDEDHDSVEITHNRTFEFLKHCEMLEKLRLCMDSLAFDPFDICPYTLSTKSLLDRLALAQPWQTITQLELELSSDENTLIHFLSSVAKTLQKLTLSRLRILPMTGSLESFLVRLGKTLRNLKELKLSSLRDAFPTERVILRKLGLVWRLGLDIYANDDEHCHSDLQVLREDLAEIPGKAADRKWYGINPCYAHYESAIVNAVLNGADELPELWPIAFLRAHQGQCSNTALHEQYHDSEQQQEAEGTEQDQDQDMA